MVYAYDQWAQLPVKDLYDSQIMLAAVSAAKDMYDKAEAEMKEFRKEYGDFYSPNAYDMQWYDKNFNPAGIINDIYARGGDPLRSSTDRAELRKWLYSRPYADLNNRKLRASNLQKYNENKSELMAKGLWNPDLEAFDLMRTYGRGDNPNTWNFDAMGIGAFDRLSPVQAKSLKDLTESAYNNRTAHELTKEQVEAENVPYDPRKKYVGFTYEDLMNIARDMAPGLTGTVYYDYYRDLARRKLTTPDHTPTQQEINDQLAKDIAETNKEWRISPVGDIDDYYKMQNLKLSAQRNAISAGRLQVAQAKLAQEENNRRFGWTFRQKTGSIANRKQSGSSGMLKQYGDTILSNGGKVNGGTSMLDQYWNAISYIPDGYDGISALAFATGMADKEQVPNSTQNKRLPVQFGTNQLKTTRNRKAVHANRDFALLYGGYKGMTHKPKIKTTFEFDKILAQNHISGFIPNNDVTIVYDEIGDKHLYDINFTTRVKLSDLTKHMDVKTIEKYANIYGLSMVNADGQVVWERKDGEEDRTKAGKLEWSNIKYVDIPTTRYITSDEIKDEQLNIWHDTMTFGKAQGAKREGTYNDASDYGLDIQDD